MSSNLDLLLINVGGTKKKVYQDLSKDFSAIEPPFWAALTAGFIRNKGYNVKIIDANAENLTHKETARIVKEDNPKLTNIVVYGQHPSASTQLMTGVGELSNEIKKIEKQIENLEKELNSNNKKLIEASEQGDGSSITDLSKKNHQFESELEELYKNLDKLTSSHEEKSKEFEEKLEQL